MKPNEPKKDQRGAPLLPQRSIISSPEPRPTQDAAARVIRTQIDNLYDKQATLEPKPVTPESATPIENINPYQRTHTEHTAPQAEQWKKYHTAWQDYYQKYYESYYTHHLRIAKQQVAIEASVGTAPTTENKGVFSNQPEPQIDPNAPPTKEEALFDLHQKLLGKVKDSATKVKKSRHFMPIISGVIVVLVLLFLQYNRVIFGDIAAYVSPGNIDPQNIIIDPNLNLSVGPEPKLIIPKINVDVPVLYDVGNDYTSQMAAMAKGVAQFAIPGASSHPGQVGNTVLAGHSSNDLFDTGDYKFIFAQLEKLEKGDTIYANYNSKRYTYTVREKQVVAPNDVSSLVYPTTKPILTLLTCTPVGTSLNRLLVIADQVSPDPNQSTAAPTDTVGTTQESIPGSSPTFFERLFSWNWN